MDGSARPLIRRSRRQGRLSSNGTEFAKYSIQNGSWRTVRKVFVPKEGCVFLDADYSQIELRVLAHMSGDEKLIEAYKENADVHQTTASLVFHVPYDEVTPGCREEMPKR